MLFEINPISLFPSSKKYNYPYTDMPWLLYISFYRSYSKSKLRKLMQWQAQSGRIFDPLTLALQASVQVRLSSRRCRKQEGSQGAHSTGAAPGWGHSSTWPAGAASLRTLSHSAWSFSLDCDDLIAKRFPCSSQGRSPSGRAQLECCFIHSFIRSLVSSFVRSFIHWLSIYWELTMF